MERNLRQAHLSTLSIKLLHIILASYLMVGQYWSKQGERQIEVAELLFPPFISVSSSNFCTGFTAPCTSLQDPPPLSYKLTPDHYLLPSQPPSHSSSWRSQDWLKPLRPTCSFHYITPPARDLETISLSLGSLIWEDYANEWTIVLSLLLLTEMIHTASHFSSFPIHANYIQ